MRSLVRLLLAVLVLGIALQCQDRQSPTEVDSTGLQTADDQEILALLDQIFNGGLQGAAFKQARNIFRQLDERGLVADAQAKAIDLVDFILEKQADGQTVGTDENVNDVIEMILVYVGYDVDYEGGEDSAIAVCSPDADCEVVTENDNAGAHIPAGAFSQDVVIIIELLPDFPPFEDGLAPAVSNFYPLPSGHDQYPQFYDIRTIPEGMELNEGFFADVGLCVLEQPAWANGAPSDVLADLVLAHPAPLGPGTGNCDDDIECLPIVNVAGLINCGDLEDGPELTGFPGLLDDFTRTMISPFSPSLLYASPGDLGGQASSFSPFAAVDPTFEDGFEDGLAWSANGFWNRTTGADIVNEAIAAEYVSLAPDDVTGGALPSAPEGSWYIWYGVPADGNYMGTQVAEDPAGSGGTSTAPNSGTITSPAFNVPSTLSNPTLSFDAWFEIESVNSSAFDLMIVSVIDVQAETVTELGRLNPTSDPGGSAAVPFTSSGFNLAPSFIERSFSLAAFSGNTIQIVFTFATGDALYNGFRGLIIDNVEVVEGSILFGLTPASTTTSSLAANRAACGEPVCPGFPQRENR